MGSVRTVNGPAAATSAATQRAARSMSAACAGSVLTLGIDANSTSLLEDPVVIRAEMRQHAVVGHHFPPSIEITWPVIQLAYSEAKNSTP